MANHPDDFDQQFQADLEKATALSLESLALEQFRRKKLGLPPIEESGKFHLLFVPGFIFYVTCDSFIINAPIY